MSSSSTRLIAAVLVTGLSLAGCTSFRPVYGDTGGLAGQAALDLAYAEPDSRLEQIIYQELALRLGRSSSPSAAQAKVVVAEVNLNSALSATSGPNTPFEVTVAATLTVTPPAGSTAAPLSISRSATAEYTTSANVLGNTQARIDAAERAAKAAAESLRLALLAAYSR
jgi:hypothetical protein